MRKVAYYVIFVWIQEDYKALTERGEKKEIINLENNGHLRDLLLFISLHYFL
jgi:hypothetical protein